MELTRKLQDILLVGMSYTGDRSAEEFMRRRRTKYDIYDVPDDICAQVRGREDTGRRFDEETTGQLVREFEGWLSGGKPSNDQVQRTAVALLRGGDVFEMLHVCSALDLGQTKLPSTRIDDLDEALNLVATRSMTSRLQGMVDRWEKLDYLVEESRCQSRLQRPPAIAETGTTRLRIGPRMPPACEADDLFLARTDARAQIRPDAARAGLSRQGDPCGDAEILSRAKCLARQAQPPRLF